MKYFCLSCVWTDKICQAKHENLVKTAARSRQNDGFGLRLSYFGGHLHWKVVVVEAKLEVFVPPGNLLNDQEVSNTRDVD